MSNYLTTSTSRKSVVMKIRKQQFIQSVQYTNVESFTPEVNSIKVDVLHFKH